MSAPVLILALLALLQGEPDRPPDEPRAGTALSALTGAESWSELVARDRRVSFSLRTRASAIADLTRADASDELKSVALMALGAAGAGGERPRIESWAEEGKNELRQAAILALGELESSDVGTLIEFASKRSEGIAESALLALARFGSGASTQFVRDIADDAEHPLAARARAVLSFVDDPASTPDLAAARSLLELRFAAARAHGLIDGQSWEVLVLDDLVTDPRFLNRVIYRASSDLRQPGIADCFFEIALEKGAPERLRGVVNAIPAELSELIASGKFKPVDEREWSALLTEIEERNLAGFTEPILRRAFLVPELRTQASTLLARGGSAGSVQLLEIGLESEDPAERAACASGLGATGLEEYLTVLGALEQDEFPEVRAAALVAQIRLGSESALQATRDLLGLDAPEGEKIKPDASWAAIVDALCEHARDPGVRQVLADVLIYLPDNLRARASAALVKAGQAEARAWLREFLREHRPGGAFGASCVQALASGAPGLEDLAVLRELFPVEDDLELDVELACALIEMKDAEILPVLRASLWNEPLNRSLLTGALWVETAGLESLRIEVLHPPVGASPRDLRRVGVALGKWGGMETVDWLAQRLNVGDPALQGAVLAALAARTH